MKRHENKTSDHDIDFVIKISKIIKMACVRCTCKNCLEIKYYTFLIFNGSTLLRMHMDLYTRLCFDTLPCFHVPRRMVNFKHESVLFKV